MGPPLPPSLFSSSRERELSSPSPKRTALRIIDACRPDGRFLPTLGRPPRPAGADIRPHLCSWGWRGYTRMVGRRGVRELGALFVWTRWKIRACVSSEHLARFILTGTTKNARDDGMGTSQRQRQRQQQRQRQKRKKKKKKQHTDITPYCVPYFLPSVSAVANQKVI